MRPNDPIESCLDFLCPFEDKLHLVMISDQPLDTLIQNNLAKCMKRTRNTFLELNKTNCIPVTFDELFRGKAHKELKSDSCVLYIHSDASTNIIKFLTNNLEDDVETMLLDKFIFQVPQDKYLFNIEFTDDETVIDLVKNMDNHNTSFQYLMHYPYLAIWILNLDEFTLIQDL